MKPINRCFTMSALIGLGLVAASTVMAQPNAGQAVFTDITITPLGNSTVGGINSAVILPHVFNDAPASIGTYGNAYPGSILLGEQNVNNGTGNGLERDIWYFSKDGVNPYNLQAGDFFQASFSLTLSGGVPLKDLEGGFIFNDPSGVWGGDDQVVLVGQGGNAGTVVQFGGPSYYPFSPGAGGYPGLGGAVPNYPNGATYRLGFNYTLDPGTGVPAFQYWVDAGGGPQYAANATTGTYFDLAGPVGNPGDYLGGYFQIAPVQVPEPSMLALLGLGVLPLARLLRRRS